MCTARESLAGMEKSDITRSAGISGRMVVNTNRSKNLESRRVDYVRRAHLNLGNV